MWPSPPCSPFGWISAVFFLVGGLETGTLDGCLCIQYFLHSLWSNMAAFCSIFHRLVEDTRSNNRRLGNCFWKLRSIRFCSFLNSGESSTCPKTCLINAWRISKQCILFPRAMGKLKATMAIVFGLGIRSGGFKLSKNSDRSLKFKKFAQNEKKVVQLRFLYVE